MDMCQISPAFDRNSVPRCARARVALRCAASAWCMLPSTWHAACYSEHCADGARRAAACALAARAQHGCGVTGGGRSDPQHAERARHARQGTACSLAAQKRALHVVCLRPARFVACCISHLSCGWLQQATRLSWIPGGRYWRVLPSTEYVYSARSVPPELHRLRFT